MVVSIVSRLWKCAFTAHYHRQDLSGPSPPSTGLGVMILDFDSIFVSSTSWSLVIFVIIFMKFITHHITIIIYSSQSSSSPNSILNIASCFFTWRSIHPPVWKGRFTLERTSTISPASPYQTFYFFFSQQTSSLVIWQIWQKTKVDKITAHYRPL